MGLASYAQSSEHSIAREWNEVLLEAIRSDLARPTVHARNLFHSAVLMYDAWALFDDRAETVFLGKSFGGYQVDFDGIALPDDIEAARHEVLSFAVYRLLEHRFKDSPGADYVRFLSDRILDKYNYINIDTRDYQDGDYRALGNYLAYHMIEFGKQDGANEGNGYSNTLYEPENSPLFTDRIPVAYPINPNKWQPLAFSTFIDQSGNTLQSTPEFLSPEWGRVTPFALSGDDLEIKINKINSYVYNDPGPPDFIQNSNENGIDDPYKWGFAMVIAWSSHLDANDPTLIDISPGALGNLAFDALPENFEQYKAFYDFFDGGTLGTGHAINPYTNLPYEPQQVKRGDYARILAEFWADGPDSETPPGHWFTILNYVNDNPLTQKRFGGTGPLLGNLEWDVKSYLTLGGAMHDAAVTTWGIKGYYDYVRPISAIRYMAWKGQSSDRSLPSYDPHGLPLIPGLIEIIDLDDPLAQEDINNVNRIKIRAWRGHDLVRFSSDRTAGVGWILGMNWWPYQRSTFVTPNFAGYLSGHSTFSRAAAQVLELITGDPYFPGGLGSFDANQNDFLVFEQGPSEDIVLQWATYKDASDQTSLSRIWGGIHPPIDDIRGRMIGQKIGTEAFELAQQYIEGSVCANGCTETSNEVAVYPIPFSETLSLRLAGYSDVHLKLVSVQGVTVFSTALKVSNSVLTLELPEIPAGVYFAAISDADGSEISTQKVIKR